MRTSRLAVVLLIVLAVAGCAHRYGGLHMPHLPGHRYAAVAAPAHPYVYAQRPTYAVAPVRPVYRPVYAAPRLPHPTIHAPHAHPPVLRPTLPLVPQEPGGYTLNSGDKLKIVVFGQEGLSSTYPIDAVGYVTLPLIGAVEARGRTTSELAAEIGARLRQGYVRDPNVTVEIDTYRPIFILGEVTTPGQYPYLANLTVEAAIAMAGGYTPRAKQERVKITRQVNGQIMRINAPLTYQLQPGDTVRIAERWF